MVAVPELHRSSASRFGARGTISLLVRWVRRDVRARYGRSALSVAWAFALPLAVTGVYCYIFGVLFNQTGGGVPYLSFFLAGMVVFRPIASAIGANGALADNYGVISHAIFPREVLPAAAALGGSIELLVMLPTLVIVGAVQGVGPYPTALLALPIMVLVVCFAVAVCIVASTIQVFVRDLQFVATFLVQGLFFLTPISYQPDQAPALLQTLNTYNPIAVYIAALRDVVLSGVAPDWPLLLVHSVLTVGLLVAAVAHLRAVGHRIVDLG